MKKLIPGFVLLVILCAFSKQNQPQPVSTPQFRASFLEKINRVRAKGCNCGVNYMPPAPPLSWNYNLELAAMGHAYDMASQNYFSHASLDGRTMQYRIQAAGYTGEGYKSYEIGENIAWGPPTIAEVMDGWFKSPGHCRNLMNPGFKEIGVAEKDGYWVQDFGGREEFSPEVKRMIKSGRYHIIERQ